MHDVNEKGFSLAEMMVAIGIGGFTLMVAVGTIVSVGHQTSAFTQSMDNDIEESRAIGVVTSYMSQAVQLRYAGNVPLETYTSTAGLGQIRDYDSNLSFGAAPATETLAVFMRDAAHSTVGVSPIGVTSDFQATAIYFQKPTPITYGVLYISSGASLQPTRSSLTFDGLERVRIMNVSTYREDSSVAAVGAPVTAFELELTFRRFFAVGETSPPHTYCPDGVSSTLTCASTAPHADVVRTYHINIRDNVLMMSHSGMRGARLYDQLHFFAPMVPGGI